MTRRISILGATGSIGQSTIDLIRRNRDAYDVVALTGGRNVPQLAKDAIELGADIAVTADEGSLQDLKDALAGSSVQAAAGRSALIEAARRPTDWTMSAIVGAAGLEPGMVALEQGGTLALANKESLVTAGSLLLETGNAHGAKILPVDSEHSAIFQALVGEEIDAVERVIITASGGAFRDWPLEQIAKATPEQAATHPNWDMGQRITIDSASMFNKAMEVIEANEFFRLSPDSIEVLVHPQSLVHALVGFYDGALMAHVGPPDMRHAIGYALHWPRRAPLPVERLDLAKIGQLNFREPEAARYPALGLAKIVMNEGGLAGAIFNGAKELALDAFIARQIGFLDMARLVEMVLDRLVSREGLNKDVMSLDTVHHADQIARRAGQEIISQGMLS
ncbi:MAG: 1-deoxy-D-xylulose-5-phosphate reductoisomerase [Paracoccaceae bacterium]|jgi:1-deoxy-D-xylulose-5-phosphate reductoisomerase|nr:1-deoxy-D-xylulose-5-phosphate reductoisomerase [Paracoccaceae bacterium]MDP7184325.1 1-deoxy-D-xylulose-5-phosphate reductoisomerase [Paracoccaceae bacterium]